MKAIVLLALVGCTAPLDPHEGPAGPPGERGPRGPVGASCSPPTTYVVIESGNGPTAALCDEGGALTGGHCQTAPGVTLYESGPLEHGWWCYGTGSAEPAGVAEVYAYAICLEL